MIRPSGPPVENATGPAAIDAALGSNVSTGNVVSANAKAGMPAPANQGMEPGTNGAPAPSAPVPNEPAPAAPATSEQNAALNAVPWEARNFEQAWACHCGSGSRPHCNAPECGVSWIAMLALSWRMIAKEWSKGRMTSPIDCLEPKWA